MGLDPDSALGGEVYDYHLLCHLAKLGAQIHVILPINKCSFSYPPGISIESTYFSKGRYANWAFGRAILKRYAQSRFDVLRVHAPRYVGLAGWMFHLRYSSIPVVVHHHHIDTDAKWLDLVILRLVMQYASAIITDSEFSRSQILKCVGGDPDKVKVVYAGVHSAYCPHKMDQHFLSSKGLEGKRLLVFVGRLIPRKNLDFLLDVFIDVSNQRSDAYLVIIGEGELRPALQYKVKQVGLNHKILFTGFVSEMEKIQWLNAADIFVSASSMEGFGLNVVEAMACGKPVIVSNAGSLPEIVEQGKTGFVVPLGDKKGFVNAILQVMEDRTLQAFLGESARKRVQHHFSWEQSAKKVLSIYEELVARSLSVD
jgi:glycosyltransferase involved in cell wall biosynthesis